MENMELRERIIQTTSSLFYENGIKSVTMDIIAEILGISKRTLYEHFADKTTLVNECYSYSLKHTEDKIKELQTKTSNKLEAMLLFYLTWISDIQKCNKNYISDMRKYHPTVYKRMLENRDEVFREKVVIALDRGILDGIIRPDTNTEIIAVIMKEQLYIIEAENPDLRKFNLTEIYETVFLSFARGISTPQGLKMIDDLIDKNKKQVK
ncbi:MAG: TetR/AcrR family transcriptional regulator [Bacteroidales bacterium]|jgi:AcrR family transcriptional regulator|nr:TetR/AcrR family transcriptional regulator [Bacteroidales bacterium]